MSRSRPRNFSVFDVIEPIGSRRAISVCPTATILPLLWAIAGREWLKRSISPSNEKLLSSEPSSLKRSNCVPERSAPLFISSRKSPSTTTLPSDCIRTSSANNSRPGCVRRICTGAEVDFLLVKNLARRVDLLDLRKPVFTVFQDRDRPIRPGSDAGNGFGLVGVEAQKTHVAKARRAETRVELSVAIEFCNECVGIIRSREFAVQPDLVIRRRKHAGQKSIVRVFRLWIDKLSDIKRSPGGIVCTALFEPAYFSTVLRCRCRHR